MNVISDMVGKGELLAEQSRTWVHVVRNRADLAPLCRQWQSLADAAVEANIFFEPWNLLPAINARGRGKSLLFVFVFHRDLDQGKTPIGFAPFEQVFSFRHWPVRMLTAWQHEYCLLSTPLLHKDYAQQAWTALIAWAGSAEHHPSFLEFPLLLAEGGSYQALLDVICSGDVRSFDVEEFARAALRPNPGGAGAYIRDAVSPGRRKELRRQRRRLQEIEGFNVRRLVADDDDLDQWIDAFLVLESSGWKGRSHSAFACSASDSDYFRAICRAAFAQARLHMIGFFIADRPIAMKCNFLTPVGGFSLKIAYDEGFGQLSPGVLLEMEMIEDIHNDATMRWLDSCAVPSHPMIDALWSERRRIKHLLVSTGRKGNFLVPLFQRLRSLKRMGT